MFFFHAAPRGKEFRIVRESPERSNQSPNVKILTHMIAAFLEQGFSIIELQSQTCLQTLCNGRFWVYLLYQGSLSELYKYS